jgi:protein SCO1/2
VKPLVLLHPSLRADMRRRQLALVTALAAAALLSLAAPVCFAHELTESSSSQHHLEGRTRGSLSQHTIPAVQLVRDDGKRVTLPEEMDDGRPVVLNFIFTSCSSVCPVMSEVFAQFAHKLGADREKVHLMSISIDPEQDTPARLREYARKFQAGPEWQHYTGTVQASLATQRAFGVDRGDKMSHPAVTLLRAAPGLPWLRLDGFITPDELLEQYRRLLNEHAQAVATR